MPAHLGGFLIAALVLLVIPGPSVLYITARGIDQGRPAAVLSACGVALGALVLAVGTAAGLSALFASSAIAFTVVKYLGAAYLIYLGVQRLLTRTETLEPLAARRQSWARVFGQGFIVEVSNPKTALFFVAFLPQFINPAHGRPWLQLLVLGALFVTMGLMTDTGYATVSGTLGRALGRRPRFLAVERYVAGGTYLALGVLAATAGFPGRSGMSAK